MRINIDDFVSRNVDNYSDMRGYTVTSNKTTSRTVFISSSEASVNYTTRIEQLNEISDKGNIRDSIDSLQLSYAKMKEVQIRRATDHDNSMCPQQSIESTPALLSTPPQHVDDDVINI